MDPAAAVCCSSEHELILYTVIEMCKNPDSSEWDEVTLIQKRHIFSLLSFSLLLFYC